MPAVGDVCPDRRAQGRAQPPAREEGLFIALQPPITREVVNRVKAATERALEAKDPPIRKIIYDFNPGGRASTSTDYGDCRDLADYLLKRRTIKTIAFVHGEVSGHAVLPVLACQEIVMSRDAAIGDGPRQRFPEEDQIAYENVAREERPAVILKMLDPAVSLLERPDGGRDYLIEAAARQRNKARHSGHKQGADTSSLRRFLQHDTGPEARTLRFRQFAK